MFKKISLIHVTEWLLYLLIFLLPWQTRWIFHDSDLNGSVFEYGRLSLYSFDIILFISFFLSLFISLKIKDKIKSPPKILLLFLAYSLLTIFWSPDKLVALYWSIRILEGIILFWLIQKINFSKTKLATTFVLAGAIQSVLAVCQFLTQNISAHKWFGVASHQAKILGDSVIEFADQRWLRAYGSFPHPNILGGFLLIALVFLVYLFFEYQNTESTKTQKAQKHIFLYGSLILINAGIFFSFSRAAWLGLGIILISLFLYFFISKKIFLIKILTAIILIWIVLIGIFNPLVKTRLGIGDVQRLEVKSTTERASSIKESFPIIKDHPFLGVGLDNYTQYLHQQNPKLQAWDYQPVHNGYLLMLAELGIVGFIILSIFNVKLLVKSVRQIIGDYEVNNLSFIIYHLSLICLLLIVYCLLFFDHYFLTNPSMFLLFWLILGISNSKIIDS